MGFFDSLRGMFSRKTTPVTKPAGSDGVWAPSGYLFSGERKAALSGDQKWLTFDNTISNCITVAAAVRVWTKLHATAEWTVEPNPMGGSDAEKCADLVQEGLIDALMSRPFNRIVAKAGFGSTFKGFAMFEQIMRRRSDGMIITADLQHRPQWSIQRWDIANEQSPWMGVEQRTKSGQTYYIPRERLLYVVEDDITDSPDGVGVLRHVIEHARRVERYEQLEGWQNETDLRGMPLGFAPLEELRANAIAAGISPTDTAGITNYVKAQTKWLSDLLEKHIKTPEISAMIDSAVYKDKGQDAAPSANKKWGFEIVKGQATGQAEVRAAINAINREIMRVMASEWLLMGDSEGARSVHEDKTKMYGMVLNGSLANIGSAVTMGPARRIVALNGYDIDTCTPIVKPLPIPLESIESACRALQLLAQAGDPIRPDDDAPDVIRQRMQLPPRPGLTPEMMGAIPRGGAVDPNAPGTPPDPNKGEVDVPLDDEEPADKAKRRARRRERRMK
jgi:hypothetical protein